MKIFLNTFMGRYNNDNDDDDDNSSSSNNNDYNNNTNNDNKNDNNNDDDYNDDNNNNNNNYNDNKNNNDNDDKTSEIMTLNTRPNSLPDQILLLLHPQSICRRPFFGHSPISDFCCIQQRFCLFEIEKNEITVLNVIAEVLHKGSQKPCHATAVKLKFFQNICAFTTALIRCFHDHQCNEVASMHIGQVSSPTCVDGLRIRLRF